MSVINLSLVFLFLGLVCVSWQQENVPKVTIELGGVTGYYKVSHGGRKYEAFEGIPYAEPPTGNLRFEPPKAVKKWNNVLPANKKSSACTQLAVSYEADGDDRVKGCEDCLYLNIYVPIRNSSELLLPVMFWIHGGAFQYGTANDVEEKLIMDRDVVLVTVNYRLGPFGFLSTGDNVVPGNMGLKDQSLALRWVKNYIQNFGGNPNAITIAGLSAGGTSVHYHYLSQMSAGLFQRGLSISGLSLNPRSVTKRAPEKAKKLGALTGCPTESNSEMIACLKNRPPRLIANAVENLLYWLNNPATPFGPVVEKQGSQPFINRSPIEIISSGDVHDIPWISGVVSEEGLYPTAAFVANDELLKQLNDNWNDISPHLLSFNESIPLDKHAEVAQKIKNHYIGSKNIDSSTVTPLIHMVGDRSYGVGLERATRLQAKVNKNPVWTYYYSYRALYSGSDVPTGTNKNYGVAHGDDLSLVLDKRISSTTRSSDVEMQQLLLDFYTSFVIEGKPRVNGANWLPLNPNDNDFHYLHIANPKNLKMECNENFAQKKFWSTIDFDEHKLPPH